MSRSKKNNLSIIPEDIESERNDSNLVLNKGKLERSERSGRYKKTARNSNRSKGKKSESVVLSRNKSRSKSKFIQSSQSWIQYLATSARPFAPFGPVSLCLSKISCGEISSLFKHHSIL